MVHIFCLEWHGIKWHDIIWIYIYIEPLYIEIVCLRVCVCVCASASAHTPSAQSKLSGFAMLLRFRFSLDWLELMYAPNILQKRERETFVFIICAYAAVYIFNMALETMDQIHSRTHSLSHYFVRARQSTFRWWCANEWTKSTDINMKTNTFVVVVDWWRIKCRLISFYLQLFCVLSLNLMWAFIDCRFLYISWNLMSLPDAQAKPSQAKPYHIINTNIHLLDTLHRWIQKQHLSDKKVPRYIYISSPYRINVAKAPR